MGIEPQLPLDGLHYRPMAMADIENADSPGEVDIAPALDVPQLGILRPRGENRRRVSHSPRNRLQPAVHQFRIARRHSHLTQTINRRRSLTNSAAAKDDRVGGLTFKTVNEKPCRTAPKLL